MIPHEDVVVEPFGVGEFLAESVFGVVAVRLEDNFAVVFELDLVGDLLVFFKGLEFLQQVKFESFLGVLEDDVLVEIVVLGQLKLVHGGVAGEKFPLDSVDGVGLELEPVLGELDASVFLSLEPISARIHHQALQGQLRVLGVEKDHPAARVIHPQDLVDEVSGVEAWDREH